MREIKYKNYVARERSGNWWDILKEDDLDRVLIVSNPCGVPHERYVDMLKQHIDDHIDGILRKPISLKEELKDYPEVYNKIIKKYG